MNPTHRRESIAHARGLLEYRPVFVDTETTAIDGEICEICILEADGRVLFNSLIKPVAPITFDAFKVHGINADMVRHCPTWADVEGVISPLFLGRKIAIYNAGFDLARLRATSAAHQIDLGPIDSLCIMRLYAKFYGEWDERRGGYKWHKLGLAAGRCGIEIPKDLHRAHADAELARQVLHYIAAQEVE